MITKCCNAEFLIGGREFGPIFWNEENQVVQCHHCGAIWAPNIFLLEEEQKRDQGECTSDKCTAEFVSMGAKILTANSKIESLQHNLSYTSERLYQRSVDYDKLADRLLLANDKLIEEKTKNFHLTERAGDTNAI